MSNNLSHDSRLGVSAKPLQASLLASNPYLSSGNFAPVTYETTASELRVRGAIPKELNGRYIKNGPSPIGPRDPSMYHWFSGTGLVNGLRLREGRAEWFRSRFTLSSDAVEALGKPPLDGPGEARLPVNTSIQVIAGRVYACVEAGANPIELDDQLDSVARSDFGGTLQGGFTAHPKGDPTTGELVAITYAPDRQALRYVHIDANGRAETRADVPAPHQPMVHDVGLTKNFVIVLDLPVTFQPQKRPGHPFPYFWNDERPSRVGLLPRSGDLNALTWFEVPTCYVFHIVNAFETAGGNVVADVIRHPRSFDQHPNWPEEGRPLLVRWTFDRKRGVVSELTLDDHAGEYPRLNEAYGARDYRFTYTAHWWGDRASTGPAYKHDVRNGRTEVHDFGAGQASLEPVFVPRVGGVDEDDGYLMLYVYNAVRNASDVVILAARDFTAPPLATVELPVRVPFGFHGAWVPDQA
jgi:carotenoid cleavage dioxygenase-like enzyme